MVGEERRESESENLQRSKTSVVLAGNMDET
jgi:hypothetical protein